MARRSAGYPVGAAACLTGSTGCQHNSEIRRFELDGPHLRAMTTVFVTVNPLTEKTAASECRRPRGQKNTP